jgi:hypothetical protein
MTTAYTTLNSVPLRTLPTTSGVVQQLLVNTTNTGNSTFAPDGLAAAPILGLAGAALQGGEMASGGIATLVSYVEPQLNGGALCWLLLNCAAGTQQVGAGIGSQQAATVGQVQTNALNTTVAGGSANALSATIASTLTALANGQALTLLASAANTGAATVTLTLGATSLASLPIVKGNNQALVAGDIPAAGYPIELNFSSTFGALVMQNPGTGVQQAGFSNIAVYELQGGTQKVSINGAAFTATGATSFPAPLSGSAKVRIWGAGGGGGASTGSNAGGGAGGGGGYLETVVTGLTTASAVVVGAGGAAGDSTPGDGGSGGTSSFGSTLQAFGGNGGGAQAGSGSSAGGSGGGATGGSLNLTGEPGGILSLLSGNDGYLGTGGGSFGSNNTPPIISTVASIGLPGTFPGGGASGSFAGQGGAVIGSTGANGLVIVEY